MTIPPQLHQPLRLLIRANHILHNHNLVDAFGHISIRHPLNPSQYIIAAYDPGAPALVKSLNDFIAYKVSDSSPVDQNSPQGYSERFIHGEIFRRYPEVKCVVHSHSEVVVPFSLGDVDVKPVFHMAGFLGTDAVPVFYAEDLYAKAEKGMFQADMLIKTQALGEALARCFDKSSPVVLQHKHGFTTWGRSVEEAVYRAIYTQMNCKLLTQAIAFAGGDAAKVAYLSVEEARACRVMNEKCVDKCWRLWVREVQVNPLYVTEEGEPDSVKVAGMNVRKARRSAAQDRMPRKVDKIQTSQAEEPKQKTFQVAETQITENFKYESSELAYVQGAWKPTPAESGEIAIQYFERPLKGYCVDCGVEVR